jgi:uncharacterized membrane protein
VKPAEFLRSLDDARIVAAIHEAEARSRGEIRVHVAEREVADPRTEAARVFEKLGMADTVERNGVLLFVAPAAVDHCPRRPGCSRPLREAFWTSVVER